MDFSSTIVQMNFFVYIKESNQPSDCRCTYDTTSATDAAHVACNSPTQELGSWKCKYFLVSVEDVVDEEAEARKQEKLERQRFWDGEANEKGHACSMWFTGLDQLVQHLVENTPPNSRAQLNFTLKPVEIRNKPEVAEVYDPKVAPRTDSYSGDWFDFKEVNKGKWILRGKHILSV